MDHSQTYQIKSTPFMRRMVSKSTKNGELQRLKQEYERIKEFNERTIEKQLRNARLRRLYRVINVIKETQPERVRARIKTEEHLRAEQINKARQLGMEFSRRNAEPMEQYPFPQASKFRFERQNPKDDAARRILSSKRIVYGNEKSRKNCERISQRSLRRLIPQQGSEEMDAKELKRSLRMKSLQYGNNRSAINIVHSQRMNSKTQEQQNEIAESVWLDSTNKEHALEWDSSTVSAPVTEINYEASVAVPAIKEENEYQSESSSQTAQIETTLSLESIFEDDSAEMATGLSMPQADSKFQQVGRYVLDAVIKHFSLIKSKSTASGFQPEVAKSQEEECIEQQQPIRRRTSSMERVTVEDVFEDSDEENELHEVSNSTNLQNLFANITSSDLRTRSSVFKFPPTNVDDTISPDEQVLSCQRYKDSEDNRRSTYPYEKIMDLRSKLSKQISTEVNDKDHLLTLRKVQNLRSIFEN